MRLQLHAKQAGDLQKLRQKVRHRHCARGPSEDGLAYGAQGLREVVARVRRRHKAHRKVDVGDAPVIAHEEAMQGLRHEAAHGGIEPARDAIVDRDQHALGIHEQIARMHVGVEEAAVERLA